MSDERLLSLEDEFSAVLKVMDRRGSTLATTLRHAWDGTPLEVMTRQSPLHAKGAHISAIAHTTESDLGRYLKKTELFNGFANRFLWPAVRRSKLLPRGGQVPKDQRCRLTGSLKKATYFARQVGEIKLTKQCWDLWEEEYPRLTADEPGIVGAVTSRAEAQVLRLAAIYAVMNGSGAIKVRHLRAALAVWDFCRDSARYIFGGRRAVTTEDKLLELLPTSGSGLTRTEISAKFHHHVRGDEIVAALENLRENGFTKSKSVKTGGRSAQCWLAIRGKHDDEDQ